MATSMEQDLPSELGQKFAAVDDSLTQLENVLQPLLSTPRHDIYDQDRIRTYMNRVKEIQDKKNAPKVDKPAAARFVKSALWQAAHKKSGKPSEGQGEASAPQQKGAPHQSETTPLPRQEPTTDGISPPKKQKPNKLQKKKKNKHR